MSYLKYALGEIVLVVIGILIALSISNWNDRRKNQKFEKEIIALIDQNLQNDSTYIAIELEKSRKATTATNLLLNKVSHKDYQENLDTLMGEIINFQRFKSQSSAFEVLKSKGIENLRDKQLQLALISYYDESLFNLSESMLDVEKQFNIDWVPVIKQEFSDFKWMHYCKLIDSKTFFEKPSVIVLFKLFKDNREGQTRRMKTALAKISEIRALIRENQRND
ncbi:MAG: DUF6090 family protein [Gillisia sp.]